MHDYHYVWLIWSVGFLCPWAVLYVAVPEHRTVMWKTSLFMAPFDAGGTGVTGAAS